MIKDVWCSKGKHWVKNTDIPPSDRIVEQGWCNACHNEANKKRYYKKKAERKRKQEQGLFDDSVKSNYLI